MIPVISLVAEKSGVGKTTLLEKIIRELKGRGWRVAIIKHHHRDFEIDQPGKDTWRHAQAGADMVAIVAPAKMAVISRHEVEPSLDEVVAGMAGVDIVIAEGYKRGDKPKIEVFRSGVSDKLFSKPEELVAIVSDLELKVAGVPCFDLEDAAGISNLLEELYLRGYNKDRKAKKFPKNEGINNN